MQGNLLARMAQFSKQRASLPGRHIFVADLLSSDKTIEASRTASAWAYANRGGRLSSWWLCKSGLPYPSVSWPAGVRAIQVTRVISARGHAPAGILILTSQAMLAGDDTLRVSVIKPEMHHIAIGDDVILAFQPEFARLARARLRLCRRHNRHRRWFRRG